ncbi:MAG: Fe(3+) ABC transporter substrate-binding protein [SAR324 cluster bacterium]|uniref:Fe(3+) ABC transporter substrate-binding protein n=1 Tax=SAR324 cluster bacterium TaxID=2024889 RepID=A0A2A4T0N8_9DELT|nr:MAG: Fe(3+) ABC transporter substrate-binding protein [SAR324 cluster bacterium]
MLKKSILKALLVGALGMGLVSPVSAEEVVNVYSARIDKLIKPAFDAFTEETGIKVRFTTAKAPVLLERLRYEGRHTEADLLITVDAGNLWHAANAGVLQGVKTPTLSTNVPENLTDPEGKWYGLTVRSRTIVYSPERVKPEELSTYEALGDPKWKGRLCLRTSKKVYNKSLVATMIASAGYDETAKVLENWMKNEPIIHPKDSGVLKAIAAGQCDVGIVNTYYLGRELKKNPNFPVALFWANQEGRGAHVNISGAGVTKHAKNKANAIKLLEFLSSEKAQNLFADENMEYPVNPKVSASSLVTKWWGDDFKMDQVNLRFAGRFQAMATKFMKRAGYK